MQLCAECDKSKPPRIEIVLKPEILRLVGLDMIPSADGSVQWGRECDTSAKYRVPDLAWITDDRNLAVVLEIDEYGHPDYQPICEGGKVWDQTHVIKKSFGDECTVVHVRYNPNECPQTSLRSHEERLKAVCSHIRSMLRNSSNIADEINLSTHLANVQYWFYPESAQHQINYMKSLPNATTVSVHLTFSHGPDPEINGDDNKENN